MTKKKTIVRIFLSVALLSFLFVALPARAVTIYVDLANAGSPTMDGSAGDPWDTIQKGVDDITNQAPTSGNTILIAAGTYAEAVVLTTVHSGADGDPNVLRTTADAIIEPTADHTVSATDTDYFIVEGFGITGVGAGFRFVTDATGFIVRNCNIYSNGNFGITCGQGPSPAIENCSIVLNGSGGLNTYKYNDCQLKNCVVAGNRGHGVNEAILCDVRISNCLFYANARDNFFDWIGPGYTGDEYWSNRNTPAEINAATGCTGNLVSNPGFTDLGDWNFNQLMANSPCLDAGVGGVDIGAHQDPPTLSLDDATYYVDVASGNDSNDGSSGSPWASITNAVALAKPGDTVIVASGIYTGGVLCTRGGSADRQLTLRADGNVVIDADGDAGGMEVRYVLGGIIDGFDITGASSYGLYLNCCSTNILRNLTLRDTTYGIYACSSILSCFEECVTVSNQYGMRSPASTYLVVSRCRFSNNTSHGYYGGSYDRSYVVFDNSLFVNNGSRGIYCNIHPDGLMRNCNIVSNVQDGLSLNGGWNMWNLENCIVAGNGGYGGMEVDAGTDGTITLTNCLFDSNASGNFFDVGGGTLNTANDINTLATPAGSCVNNLVGDPLFRNWWTWNMRLCPNSPCINAGTTNTILDTDYYGRPRLVGTAVDIGMYEMPCAGFMIMGY